MQTDAATVHAAGNSMWRQWKRPRKIKNHEHHNRARGGKREEAVKAGFATTRAKGQHRAQT